MKRIMAIFVLSAFCISSNLGAMSIYNAMNNGVVGFGELIEKSDLPLIGKLTDMLPFGMVATSCKKYPGQTMLLCAGLLYYILSQNETVVTAFNAYKDSIFAKLGINRKYDVHLDDTLFIFDGDDAEDAQEQMDTEDELLADDSSDAKRNRNINFL